jgi:NADH pyrophosphatase NudC (nudix superfamily)
LREVNEEIGVKIKKEDLGEFFYQENPSKDIGVYLVDWKKYQNKKIKLDKTELTSSDWFNIKHLPPIDKKQEQIFQDLKTSLKNLK